MRNKIVATIFLVASIILVIKSLNPLKIYNFIEKGNSFIKEEKYSNGREEYENALKLKENNQVKLNVLKSFYSEKNYEEVTKSNVEEGFLKGNSYVYLGDNSQDKNKEFYKKALEEYKLAMKTSDDINIKKNYELTLKKLEDMSKQQNQDNQQNQEDKQEKQNKENQNNNNQNQQNNSQENSEQNQNSKDNNNSQNQEDKSSQSNEKNQSSNNKEQEKKENSSQEKQNNEKEQESNSQPNEQNNNKQNEDNTQENENQNESSDKKENNQNSNTAPQNMKEPSQEEIREQEVRAILKRLEGNEKQSFKNNERVMDINSNNPSNRW